MRFLREMIVRKAAAGVPGDMADEPPVKDFFELPPMRDRLARSRSAEPDAQAPEVDEDDPEDAGDVAAMVAQRLSAARHVPVEKPRDDRRAATSDGFDDLEFGDFDPAELDALDLDAPPAADRDTSLDLSRGPSGHAPHLARRPMSAPPVDDAAEGPLFGEDDGLDEGLSADELTDDPALAAPTVGQLAEEDATPRGAAPGAGAEEDRAAARVPAGDEASILANIAAALPPSARAIIAPAAAAALADTPSAAAEPVARATGPADADPDLRSADAPAPVWPAAVPAAAPAAASAAGKSVAEATAPRSPRIWDLEPEAQEAAVIRFAETAVPPAAVPPAPPPVSSHPAVASAAPEPAASAAPRRSGRVRTRLLGFTATDDIVPDPMAGSAVPRATGPAQFPVGWIVVVDGPGRGAAFTLGAGVSSIGRDEDQVIQLDFGDTAISRHMHAAIAYDPETRGFFLGQGGKSNIVRLNGRPVLSTEDLKDGDVIRIGETTLKLVAFCGRHFDWADPTSDAAHVPASVARGDAGR